MDLTFVRSSLCACAAVSVLLSGEARAQGLGAYETHFQNSTYFSVGYVANAPRQMIGAGVIFMTPKLLGGGGFSVTFKMSHDDPSREQGFEQGVTREQAEEVFGDFRFRDRNRWIGGTVAFTRPVGEELALYLGAGYSQETQYAQYEDLTRERGLFGLYWIQDGEPRDRVNLVGGLLMRMGPRIIFVMGVETAPRGVTAGVQLALVTSRR